MIRMKFQRTVNKNKHDETEEFGRGKQNKNGTDNRKHDKGKRKRRKNPNNHTFQDVGNSGGSNSEKAIKVSGQGKLDKNTVKNYNKQIDNFDENNLSDIVNLLSKSIKQKFMKMISGMTENNQMHKRRSLLPQA